MPVGEGDVEVGAGDLGLRRAAAEVAQLDLGAEAGPRSDIALHAEAHAPQQEEGRVAERFEAGLGVAGEADVGDTLSSQGTERPSGDAQYR